MKTIEEECLEELNFSEEDLNDFKKLNRFNECYQLKIGVPEYDYLTLNGYRNIDDYSKSIKDVDYEDYLFQKEHGTMVRKEYDSLYLPEIWFRAIYKQYEFSNKGLIYGSLISAREYGLNYVLNKLNKKIDKKYPFIYQREKSELTEDGFYSMKLKVKAGGKETERKALLDKLDELRKEIENEVIKVIQPLSGYTFIREPKNEFNGNQLYIIGGFEAAENIFYKSFFNDFFEREESIDLLKKELKKVVKKFKEDLLGGEYGN